MSATMYMYAITSWMMIAPKM